MMCPVSLFLLHEGDRSPNLLFENENDRSYIMYRKDGPAPTQIACDPIFSLKGTLFPASCVGEDRGASRGCYRGGFAGPAEQTVPRMGLVLHVN